MRHYWRLVAANRAFVAFGFVMALTSSFGQTYFVGVFGPSLREEFGLSHTGWGSVYLVGTLGSAAVLPWTGKLIDRIDLRYYALLVTLMLAGACAFMAGAVTGIVTLTVAIFLLRQLGQGLASHVAITSMTRYFDRDRGSAIAIATLGFAAGEAMLPFGGVQLIDEVGWRWTYACVALGLAFVVAPVVVGLLLDHARRHRAYLDAEAAARADGAVQRSWTRAEVLRDVRFYLLLPGLVAPALVITALFFHHLEIADAKGWTHAWITGNYVVFAATGTLAALACGPLIDRVGGVRLAPMMLVPMAAGLVLLAAFDHAATAPFYLALVGVTVGIAHTAVAAMWAELYGVGHLGAIRSAVSSLAVFATALGPVTMGALFDAGVDLAAVLLLLAGYAVAGALLIAIALRREPRVPSDA